MIDVIFAIKFVHVLGASVLFGTGLGIASLCLWPIAPAMRA